MKATRFTLILLAAICLLSLAQMGFAQTYQSITVPLNWDLTGCLTRESTHFRMIWGTTGPESYMMTDDYINGNLNMLEAMWLKYFGTGQGQMAFQQFNVPLPRNGNYYKISLYCGQTGQTMDDGGGCWCGYDGGGTNLPFCHLPADCLRYSPPSGATPHEFGHAYENQAGGMHDASCGAWWECTANWMELQFNMTYPGPGAMITMPYYFPCHGRNYYDSWQLWEYYKQATGYGVSAVNRIWTQGTDSEFILAAAMRLDTSSNPDKLAALKDCFGEVAKRAITWDYTDRGSYLRAYDNYNMNIFDKYQRGAFAQPSFESGSTSWYRCPWDVTPQQMGYTMIPLAMPGKSGSAWQVTCNFKGLVDSGRGSDWRACLVTVNDSGVVRYSTLWSTGNNSITLNSVENHLYLTVAATPSVQTINGFIGGEYRNANKAQFPFEFTLTNAQPAEYMQDRPGVAHHAHSNGGGWVADSATVDSTAYVGPNAMVKDTAQVRTNARIEDYAVVGESAIVRDYAVVSGHAYVHGSAIVQGNAKVRDYAQVFSGATISNDAKAIEHCNIDNAKVSNYAVVKGTTYCWQDGTNLISGDSIWDGDTAWGGNTSHGIVFDWLPSAPYTTANPTNLYCLYSFTTTKPFLAWDEYGVTHGYLMGSPSIVTDSKTARGNELQLNGSTQWVELRNDVSDFRDITVAIWANWAGSTTNQRLVSFGDGGSKQMYITPKDGTTNNLRFVITDGTTTQYVNGTAPLMTSGWQHVAFTLSGTTGILYVNGSQVGTGTITLTPDKMKGANIYSAGSKNYVGRGNSGNYFNGKVDDFRVYSNAQSAGTIGTLGAGGDYSNDKVVWYKFDETSGTSASDSSGNGKTGTLVGSCTWVAGAINNAVNIPGGTSYVTVPNNINSGITNFTVATWVKLTSSSANMRIFDFGSSTTNYMEMTPLHSTSSGKVQFVIRTSSTTKTVTGTAALPTGSWQHVAVTLSGQVLTLYVQGAQVGQITNCSINPNSLGSTTQDRIGDSQTTSHPHLNGIVDDFRFYNRALTLGDIAALATLPRNIPQTANLLFSAITDTFPASGSTGNWASYLPSGQWLTMMNTPTVQTINSKKWEQNLYADGDGYDQGTYSSSIAVNGASIVIAVRPTRTTDSGNWRSIVDIFYDRLVLGLHNNDGLVNVRRNGSLDANTTAIPDNQLTVLSLVCQSDGKYKVWANGTLVMDIATTSAMTSLVPGVAGGFANHINVGRNNPDGWTVFNGAIGDVFVYKIALTDADRQTLEADIRAKFGF